MSTKTLKLADITIDAGTQARTEIDQETVDDYALAIKRGDIFPPVDVFSEGSRLILAEGFHRYHANRKAGETVIEAEIHIGTLHEARAFAFRLPRHGKRWTSADKRRVITLMLDTDEWGVRSDRAIAEHIGVDHTTVGVVRRAVVDSTTNRQNVTAGGGITGGADGGKKGGKKGNAKPGSATKPKTKTEPEKKPQTPEQAAMAAGIETVDEINDRMRFDLERTQNEAGEFRRLASATDQGAENVKLLQRLMVATRRQDELMAEAASLKRLSDFYQHQLARVGKSIGERDMDKIAPAVESLTRRVREKYPSLLDVNGVTKAPVAAVRR